MLYYLGIFVLFGAFLSAQFLKRDPSEIGQLPYGEWEETSKPYSSVSGLSLADATHKRFWMVAGAVFYFGRVASIIITHIVPYITDLGISTSTAANIQATTNGVLNFGAIIFGITADRIGYLSDIYHSYFIKFLLGTILSFPGLLLVITLKPEKSSMTRPNDRLSVI